MRPGKRTHRNNAAKGRLSRKATRTGLARALSKLGFCSRAAAAQLIRAGRVRLNSAVRCDPETPVNLGRDQIAVDGVVVQHAAKIYLVLNKPRGVVTTAADEKGRKTVYDCLPPDLKHHVPWLAPVGRLDRASEGLLLLTNDSQWAARITAPETHVEKIYHVQIASLADNDLLKVLTTGVNASGDVLWVKRAGILRHGERNTWLEIVLDEGKNRHLRRMLDAVGVEVLRLIRVAIGSLPLGDLPKGATRRLTPAEMDSLDRAMRLAVATK
jgi:23S rRNA pseudouridine2605 synthase